MIRTFYYNVKIVVVLFVAWLCIISCENDIKQVQDMGKKTMGVDEAKNIETYLSQGSKIKAKLTAPLMLRYQTDSVRVEFPKSLHVDFFDSSSAKVESQLFAKFGSYYELENKVFLRDSVTVFNIRKDTLWCKELYWDQVKGTFFTDKPIIISQQNPRQKIYGSGLIADQNFKWFTISKIGHIYTGHESFVNVPDSSY